MKWRLSLEGASVLAARADRMENVCVMQQTASDKRSVFWYSPLCTQTQTKNMLEHRGQNVETVITQIPTLAVASYSEMQ